MACHCRGWLAHVLAGPSFDGPEFLQFLAEHLQRLEIEIALTAIDAGIVPLATTDRAGTARNVTFVVSSLERARMMNDKQQANDWFVTNGLPVPRAKHWPRLAKPRQGASSRGQVLLRDPAEFEFWASRNRLGDFVLQEFVQGTEYSVDAYVARNGRVLGAVPRQRVEVSGGEVMVAVTSRCKPVLDVARALLEKPGWFGPLNIQVMLTADGPLLLEVNPRCGSGITLSMEAGLDVAT